MSNEIWPPTGTIETISDIDISANTDGTYSYLSTFVYGINAIIDSVYKINFDGNNNNKPVIISPNNYSYDKRIGNIKIILPVFDYTAQFIVNYHKKIDNFVYINKMFAIGSKQTKN